MRKQSITCFMALSLSALAVEAQEKQPLFNHLDLGVTMGTTGVGIDITMPVTNYAKLRTGFSYIPRVEVPMTFGVQVGDDPNTSQTKFDRLSGYLASLTGNQVSSEVEMIGKPNFWNWSLMVDVFPLKNNRHWHVTAGFYLGPSKVAEAYNKTESMASLMAVSIYNRMYDKLHGPNGERLTRRQLLQVKLFDLPGTEDFGTDPDMLIALEERMHNNGRMGVHMGVYQHDIVDEEGNVVHKKGDDYMMDPDDDNMVKADMKVNPFKPYVGFGYDGRLLKKNDRVKIGFDAGVMFWGGTPSLTTHDGTDLIHDVENIGGKVGDYVSAIEKFKAFPLLNLRLTYKLF